LKNKLTEHFSRDELACRCCGKVELNFNFLKFIEKVRTEYGQPMIVTSATRCEQHNTKVGGVKYSAHLTGEAADIFCADSMDRYKLVSLALKHGAEGIGVYDKFVHMDTKTSQRQGKVIWV
jgi:uncharacterized protein YcbK (DUF882 family)